MNTRRFGSRAGALLAVGVMAALVALAPRSSRAGFFDAWFHGPTCRNPGCSGCAGPGCVVEHQWIGEPGGTWVWLRSPEEERKVIIGLYSRYCIRCHGVNGQGVWDIPGVPDFTNPRFQACRSDGQLVRAILEGRGAVMPPFRGTLTLEEGWGMARYLRTFLPGNEKPRSDRDNPKDKDKDEDKEKDKDKDKGKDKGKEKEKDKDKGKDKDKASTDRATELPAPIPSPRQTGQ
jgi:hypothetical protein